MTGADDLTAALERRCLAGLAETARTLAGDDPAAVCSAFDAWKRSESRRAWPWLPGLCFTALEGLGLEFPVEDTAAVTLGRLVVGAETDPRRVERALDALEGVVAPPPRASLAGGADLSLELRRRTLETAVDRFWAELGRAAEQLRGPVVARDRPRADAIIVTARRQLEETAEHVHTLAKRVEQLLDAAPAPSAASEAPSRSSDVAPSAAPPAPPPVVAPLPDAPADLTDTHGREADGTVHEQFPLEDTGPLDIHDAPAPPEGAPEEVGPAPDTTARLPDLDDDEAYPDDEGPDDDDVDEADVEYRRVRERRLAPMVFLAGVTLGALVWLLIIAGNGG